jgi:hypothetical protein
MVAIASIAGISTQHAFAGESGSSEVKPASANTATSWQSEAEIRRNALFPRTKGTLVIDDQGVVFQARDGRKQNWRLLDIHSFVVRPHQLLLQTYNARSLHRPGEQSYQFELKQAVPPAVAASLANALRRPSRNAVPDPESPTIASISVRHQRRTGGTNGILRFRKEGIDYITDKPGDSRSWRWEDLQTLTDPDPFHLIVFGYRDTYTFDLKEPLSRRLFDQAADMISARNLGTRQ